MVDKRFSCAIVVIRDHNLRNHIEHVESPFHGLQQEISSNLVQYSLHDQSLAMRDACFQKFGN